MTSLGFVVHVAASFFSVALLCGGTESPVKLNALLTGRQATYDDDFHGLVMGRKPGQQDVNTYDARPTAIFGNDPPKPATPAELQRVITSHQAQLTSIQNEVSTMLKQLKVQRQQGEFQEIRRSSGRLHITIGLPSKPAVENPNPHDDTKRALQAEQHLLKSDKGIPTITLMPTALQESDTLSKILQEDGALEAVHRVTEAASGPPIQVATPAERLSAAIKNIDEQASHLAEIKAQKRFTTENIANGV